MDTGVRVLPFVRRFFGQPSLHIWEDEVGDVQDIPQGERIVDPFQDQRALRQDATLEPQWDWRGDHPSFASCATGRRRVGSPVGHDEFIKAVDEQGDGTPDASGTNTSGA